MSHSPIVRCAIYTRKSSEEGLEQSFNSLHAQREACEAYITSQKHEGWMIVPTAYDDGGFSGGTMERPGLKALLEDVRERRINVVVVYKIDRLTRSLFDFAKIVEVLDAGGASFVSVTQSFNTTTSMGRLTLNVLLSFAQFEREVTGERIRDKIAASRRKGMWMGGNIPIGYDLEDHRLVPNDQEARTIRLIFETYLSLGSVRSLKRHLDKQGILTRRRHRKTVEGTEVATGGIPFGIGHLYTILRNPIYVGKARHKGKVYPGQHAAIINEELWSRVEAQLDGQAVDRRAGEGAKHPSLLTGLLHWEDERRLTPTHAVKGAKRYRYYATASSDGADTIRLPSDEVDRIVTQTLVGHLCDASWLADILRVDDMLPASFGSALAQAECLAERLRQPDPAFVRSIVDRIVMGNNGVRISMKVIAFLTQLGIPDQTALLHLRDIMIESATTIVRKGRAQRMVIDANTEAGRPEPSLVLALVRARRWFKLLVDKGAASIADLARVEGVNRGWISNQIALAFLAPDIVRSILNGAQPISLTLERLIEIAGIPDWADQRAALGRA